MKSPEQIARDVVNLVAELRNEKWEAEALARKVHTQLYKRAADALEKANRTQRQAPIITVRGGGYRVAVTTPHDAARIVSQMLDDGYLPSEIEWEVAA